MIKGSNESKEAMLQENTFMDAKYESKCQHDYKS